MRIGILTKVFTAELVDAAIAKHGRVEQRRRILPARLVVYFVLALCLFARESYEEVLGMLTSGIPGSQALARVNRSSLCRARSRLGEDVLETPFREVTGPLATPDTPGAWWRGLRLLALDGTQFDLPGSVSNGNTFDGPSTTGGLPFGFPQVRAVVLAEIGTHGVLDARLGGYRDGERRLAYQLADSTSSGDLVIADRGFWSVEFARVFTVTGADLLVRLQSNHSVPSRKSCPTARICRWHVRARKSGFGRAGKTEPCPATRSTASSPSRRTTKVAFLGTTLLDPEQYPAAELVALYRERWEIELAFDEIKSHLGPGGPIRSRTPEGVRQELWAYLAVHHAIRRFAHTAALSGPALDTDRVSCLKCVRIIRRSVPSQLGANTAKLTRSLTEAGQEARSRLLPARRKRKCPRAIKKPNRWPVLRTRAKRDAVKPGRWALNQTTKAKTNRRAGRPMHRETRGLPPEAVPPAP
ncbi:IS4 family transposase [Streptomyces sp. NPDC006785]|uniref:IS4 family transposase n=1 Tax=Streptomyces sp. NPDC006785 TaxID=3155461 RepID=UPI0033D5682D